jgi:hypothetical protein
MLCKLWQLYEVDSLMEIIFLRRGAYMPAQCCEQKGQYHESIA